MRYPPKADNGVMAHQMGVRKIRACAAGFLTVAITMSASAAVEADTKRPVPTKSITYGGLSFSIPATWSVGTPAQLAGCGVHTPAIILGGLEPGKPCSGTSIPVVSTLAHVLTPSTAQGTYESAASQRDQSFRGGTTQTRKFTHDGVHVLLFTTEYSGKISRSRTTIPPNTHTVWGVQAYFRGYRVTFIAGSPGGQLGGSLAQTTSVVESVRPTQ
jgi:hypothetical protein